MKRKKLISGEISIWTVIILTAIAVGFFILLLLPELLHLGHRPNPRLRVLVNLKQISTGTIIYLSDYDGYYPPASGMPAIRVAIEPYIKSNDLYKPVIDKSTTPQFNFNLAGVSETLPSYPGSARRALNEVAMWSSHTLGEKPGMIITFADSSARILEYDKFDKINAAFEGQFDRKGVKLWPADYLKSLDPLK